MGKRKNRTGMKMHSPEALFRSIAEATNDALIVMGEDERIIALNPAAERIFGWDAKNLLGQLVHVLMPDRYHQVHREAVSRCVQTGVSTLFGKPRRYEGVRRDGAEFPAEISISGFRSKNGWTFFAFMRDITEQKKSEEMVRQMAYYDTLTGLPNRTLLLDYVEQAILSGQRENKPVALLLMDLDHFKEINDTLGHQRGDALLQQIGPRLQSALRENDVVARLGGDEFAVLLPLAEAEHAGRVARKIQKALEPLFLIESLPIAVEPSIGIALYPDHGANAGTLIQRADVAMYAAKQSGSGYIIYDPKYDRHSPRRLALMGELRQAIGSGQLLLHYQPKIDLRSRRITGVEALVRWQHPEHGLIPPDEFIGPAEQTGLIKPLTLWILETALVQCMTWHQMGLPLSVAVNLSARNLQDSQLPEQVTRLLQACALPHGSLGLEITESVIMTEPVRAMEVLTRLHQMGVQLSIDDFGTGYSSLGYLNRLPVEEIKIDRSFIKEMAADEDAAVIVRSTIDLGHNLGLKVVAEGVEDQAIWNRLSALGCDSAQGYYMCRPLPSVELGRWLTESPWGLNQDSGDAKSSPNQDPTAI